MRFSTVTALCAAPLALAGSLQAELVPWGVADSQLSARDNYENQRICVSMNEGKNEGKNDGSSKYDGSSKDCQNNRGGSSGDTKTAEIIIIWVNNGNNAPTQKVNPPAKLPAPAAGASTPAVAPATHVVMVGGAGGLVFTPDQVQAAVGDTVIFEFHSQNHTATQSTFNTPCDPLPGGMDTGFMPNPNNSISPAPQVAMQVTVATPLWFYCRQGNHCGKGMTFSINPSANKTQAMFKQMAIAQKGSGSPSVISGGQAAAPGAAPPASAPPSAQPAANGPSMVGGTGQMANGACECSCLCGAASFPNAAIQGVGAFGGISGALPMSALEA